MVILSRKPIFLHIFYLTPYRTNQIQVTQGLICVIAYIKRLEWWILTKKENHVPQGEIELTHSLVRSGPEILPEMIEWEIFSNFFLIFSLPWSYVTFNVDAIIVFAHKKLKKPVQKVAYLWQLGVYFLCSPDCPKQPRTSFPLYEFSQTISSRIKWKISSKLPTEPLGTLYYVCIDQYKIKVPVFSIQCAFEILKYYVSVLNLKNIGK